LLLIISLVLFIVNGQIPCDDEYGIIITIITITNNIIILLLILSTVVYMVFQLLRNVKGNYLIIKLGTIYNSP
jgi:hypothetical protein